VRQKVDHPLSLRPSFWLLWAALTHRRVSPMNPELGKPHDNHGTHFGYGYCIPRMYRVRRARSWMTHKLFLLCLFTVSTEPNRFASSAVTRRDYKVGLVTPAQPTSSYTISSCATYIFLKNREIDLKENKRGSFQLIGRLSFFPFSSKAKLDWHAPVVTREHLQNLVSQGYMTTAELATYRVPTDPASPTPAAGYVVA
jgi:hypothetical protein